MNLYIFKFFPTKMEIFNRFNLLWLFLIMQFPCLTAQTRNVIFNVETSGGYVTNGNIPFWLRSNRNGSVPLDNFSVGLTSSLYKNYKRNAGKFDWGGGLEARINAGKEINTRLIEGYGKIRFSHFEIKVGRSIEIVGLCDSSLSSGSFSISGNAPGIPKIQIGISDFATLPVFGELIAFKFNYSHGWLGETSIRLDQDKGKKETWFYQKSLYLRFGKPDSRVKIYSGFNHQVFWGNEKHIFGKDWTLSAFQTYLYILTGKEYSTDIIEPSSIGNHLGSLDMGIEYKFETVKLYLYRQHFYDYIALANLANLRDGLNGIVLENKANTGRLFKFRKFLVEFLFSKDQGEGFSTSDPTYYIENYYNNYIYTNGWSYKNYGLGSPFLTPNNVIRKGLSNQKYDHFVNNRVIAFHLGVEGSIARWEYLVKASISKNYGSYLTYFSSPLNQFSAYLEGSRDLRNGMSFGFITAFDKGKLYYNSSGLLLKVSKSFR